MSKRTYCDHQEFKADGMEGNGQPTNFVCDGTIPYLDYGSRYMKLHM
jgi:hypothetical protein